MARTQTTMPSSITTVSTENDSVNSPGGVRPRHAGMEAESPRMSSSLSSKNSKQTNKMTATSTSSPADSPRDKPNGYERPPTREEGYSTKRKRSGSFEEGARSPREYDYSPPKRSEQPQQVAGQALHEMGKTIYYSPTGDGGIRTYDVDRPPSRDQSVDHLQHTNNNDNEHRQHQRQEHTAYSITPPPLNHADGSMSPQSRSDSTSAHIQNVVSTGKRKRNFSNRTKTGCMTCRQRKKKCDEGRPTCNNCQRGGFQCQGYTVVRSSMWTKTNGSKVVPLQSKEGGHPDGEPTSAHPSSTGQSHQQPQQQQQQQAAPHQTTSSVAAPPATSMDGGAEPNHAHYAPGSESRGRPAYSGQTWPPQQGHPQTYTNEHLPSLSELARSDSTHPPPPPPPSQPSSVTSRDMSGRPASQTLPPAGPPAPNPSTGHWPPPTQTEYRPSYPPPPPPPRLDSHHNPPPMRVSTSGYDYQKSGAKTFTVEEVERSRMLRHTRFNYFDPTLKNERQRCAEALARYNNACMLRSGVTEQEAQIMLMKVFDPTLDTTHHPVAPCKEKGVLGPGVKIEGPFNCTYGYNLRIMDNVFIGENTRIDDSARVDIGARTWIGANVTILTMEVSKDMVDRKGTESTCYASPVVIHPEVVVGANAVIYPGVTLSRGSTVEPFALVRDSLGENQVQRAAVGHRTS